MSSLENGMMARRLAHFRSAKGSRCYQTKYLQWNKRLAHHVECAILHRMLRRVGRSREVLDAPSGPGRFFDTIAQHADAVHLGDISTHMLDVAREQTQERAASYTVMNLLNVSPDTQTFEGVISLRLSHHIYEAKVLDEYFHGLALLARRWLILTFRDARTPRTLWRRLGRRIRGKGHLPAQSADEIVAAMRDRGFHLDEMRHVSRWFSGHRYALFVRHRVGNSLPKI